MKSLTEVVVALFVALGALAGVIALIFGISLLFAIPVYLIVNYLFSTSALTAVFGCAKLTFWQAYWLSVLSGFVLRGTTSTKKEK